MIIPVAELMLAVRDTIRAGESKSFTDLRDEIAAIHDVRPEDLERAYREDLDRNPDLRKELS